ncbi:MAG: DUF6775 family putative metallopeptidase [bacterium]
MLSSMIHLPSFVYLYQGAGTNHLNLEEIARYLKSWFQQIKIVVREDFFSHYFSHLPSEKKETRVDEIARELAGIKVRQVNKNKSFAEPLGVEVEYERRKLLNPKVKSFGILYDGFELQTLFSRLVPEAELSLDHCHLIFTNQLFGTWSEDDHRYHARVSLYGFPSLISTTGVVEAPAKPRDFYLKQQLGVSLLTLKEEFKGRFIDHNDPRLTEVMKGYVMQTLFFHITGNPFCENRNCRLYNAHWQEDLIQAQLTSKNDFCGEHQKLLNRLAGK